MKFPAIIKSKFVPIAAISALALGTLIGASAIPQGVQAEKTPSKEELAKMIKEKNPEIKNVIFLIGDGMGVPYTSAHRYMKDNPRTKDIELTEFDKHLVGMQTTHPDDPAQNITDSASAATAMSGGVKTYNNAIAVDNDLTEVKTVLEQAKSQGKSTGLVATSEITHATPASFGAHDESRKNMNQIADDYYDEMVKGSHKIDVMLGGGKSNFVRSDRDLTKLFTKDGYSYVTNRDDLMKNRNSKVLGLFADGGMDKMIDRKKETPSLEEMTKVALNKLNSNKNGFFLMVEGSQIDWAGHDNDVVAAMSEMEDFEMAFKAAIDFAKKDKHTLVVATADHSTGGFSMGAGGEYNFKVEPILAAKKTPDYMAARIMEGMDTEKVLKDNIKLDLTQAEIDSVKAAAAKKNLTEIDNAIEQIFNKRSFTGWTTSGHTGEEVQVYAFGPGKENFSGLIDNTDQAKKMFKILKENK
ncbi:alkaline phosphatase [Metabacillus sp. KIGAM252]|uniref:Alkaline phosphatase n=1 Tax=Metabacillus flavus TaxID=2823519 RepID=A0ABS5LJS0_9BACI|nr:alkaline phosphatase [Metabacillus flavus]MBS2970997.1 alkaline phosphatase [Metabacillus flavus]